MKLLIVLLLLFPLTLLSTEVIESPSPSFPTDIFVYEGYVKFSFDIEKDGTPSNIKIVESVPKRTFDKEALNAIKRWKFKPKISDGKPIKQFNMRYKLEFKLED